MQVGLSIWAGRAQAKRCARQATVRRAEVGQRRRLVAPKSRASVTSPDRTVARAAIVPHVCEPREDSQRT